MTTVDWGEASWLEEEPEDQYQRPIIEKEKICETCRVPKPCWCD